MAIVVEIDQLRKNIRGNDEKITSLKTAQQAALTNLAVIQMMREVGNDTLKIHPETDNEQTFTHRSPILDVLKIPVEHQLMIAEALANLEVVTTEAMASVFTAAITKKRETLHFGNLQRQARQFSLAQPHLQELQRIVQRGINDLPEWEKDVLADPSENAIIRFQRTAKLLTQSDFGLKQVGGRLSTSFKQAQENASKANLPDAAINAAINSGIAQGIKSPKSERVSVLDTDDLSSFLTTVLAEEVKFI